MNLPYSSASIANSFLKLAFASKSKVSPMKIQKLVYLAHGYSLALRETPLVDELFEAWRFGPVLPSLYHAFKGYGDNPISSYIKNSGYDFLFTQNVDPIITDLTVIEVISFVWDNYGQMDPLELSDWTHEKGAPWDTVINEKGFKFKNQSIDNQLIKEYFKNHMLENDPSET